jgi:hypothetical protein
MESDHGDTSDGLNQGVHDVDLSDEEVGYDEEDTGDNFDEGEYAI